MKYYDYDGLATGTYSDRIKRAEEAWAERIAEKKKYFEAKKARNKTYLKGQRGKRLYYDYSIVNPADEDDDYDPYVDGDREPKPYNTVHPIKCIFTRELRREKLYKYFKYLKGRKVLVRDLAWKFAVTERTIQTDIKWLIDNGFVERRLNKTFKGKQTRNSYLIIKGREKELNVYDDNYYFVFISKKQNDYYVLSNSDYDEKQLIRGKINASWFDYDLPNIGCRQIKDIKKTSMEIANKLFLQDLSKYYKGNVCSHISKGSYEEEIRRGVYKKECWTVKDNFILFLMEECLPPQKEHIWIKLSIAPRRIKQFKMNKGLKYISNNILGVK